MDDLADVAPGFDDAVWTVGHLVLDEPVEAGKVVAGDTGVDVMFGVVVHVPIKELEEGIDIDGAAAEAKVLDVVGKADVLTAV